MKKRELAPLIAIAAILLALSIGSLILPDRVFSDNENRYLQQTPSITVSRVMDGRFTAEAESYTSDQIVLRDFWMGAKSVLQRAMGQKDIGGVWLGKDGHYFAKLTDDDFDRAGYQENLEEVKTFFEAHSDLNCRFLPVPTPAAVMPEKLPCTNAYDAKRFYQEAQESFGDQFVDTWDALAGAEDPYYRTDHHWTTQGAYAAYMAWCDAVGQEPSVYELTAVSDHFRGTLYSKVLLPDSPYDTVCIAADAAICSMDCDGTVTDSLYRMDMLEEKDHYKVFMGGNYAKVTIDTGVKNGKKLLVVKDSFANSFVPFLSNAYETVTMLDLRYYKESVEDLAAECTDVLVLYEMSNFAEDDFLFRLNQK